MHRNLLKMTKMTKIPPLLTIQTKTKPNPLMIPPPKKPQLANDTAKKNPQPANDTLPKKNPQPANDH